MICCSASEHSIAKNQPRQKSLIPLESPLSTEQRGKVRFCIGYCVHEIRGIKRMRVEKATIEAFRK